MEAAREDAMTQAFGDPATGKLLAHTPEVLLAVFFITIWLTPLLISLLGFDNVSGDMQHKTRPLLDAAHAARLVHGRQVARAVDDGLGDHAHDARRHLGGLHRSR